MSFAVNLQPALGDDFLRTDLFANGGLKYFRSAAGQAAQAGLDQAREHLADRQAGQGRHVVDFDRGECFEVQVGMALFFQTYSTWTARPGIWLEDFYVLESHRNRGIGTRLLDAVVGTALARDLGRVEWSVLDWNTPSIRYYERRGARLLKEWNICRLDGDALTGRGEESGR